MYFDSHALKIYVDGSAIKNPGGPGGVAGIVEYPDQLRRENEVIFEDGYLETTNNRMELRACITALEYARKVAPQLRCRILIISDSMYVNDNYPRAPYWKKNGWTNVDDRPIENADLWNEILLLRPKVKATTEFQWIKGKSSPLLKEVDRRAKAAAARPMNVDRGFRGGKVGKSKTLSRSASTLFPACRQQAVINIYRKKLAGRSEEDKIYFDLFSDEEGKFVAKHHAYTSAEVAHELHRSHRYRVRFNDDAKHPIVECIIEEISTA